MSRSRLILGIVFLISTFANLNALPIDLGMASSTPSETLQIDIANTERLDLFNFKENTVYVVAISGPVRVTKHDSAIPVKISDNNTLMIENATASDILVCDLKPLDNSAPCPVNISIRGFRTDIYPNLGNEKWRSYIDYAKDWINPSKATRTLGALTQDQPLSHVLALGPVSGRDPIYWIEHGSEVTLLDATPYAIGMTAMRLADRGLLPHLKDALICRLEATPEDLGLFDAVVGTVVFCHLPPEKFAYVMADKVLPHVAPSGYFAGHFFGPEHAWRTERWKTFISIPELHQLFADNGFEIVWIDEVKKDSQSAFRGIVFWHEIAVIARRK